MNNKKFYFVFFALILLVLISLSGCGGSHGSFSDSSYDTEENYKVKQVAVITSPAIEIYKSYKILTGSKLSGIGDAKYFVANIGSEASQAVLNLGFSESLSMDKSFVIINSDTNDVIFAYNPSGIENKWKTSGNIRASGGKLLRYRSLVIGDPDIYINEESNDYEIVSSVIPQSILNNITEIILSGDTATYDGQTVAEYNYFWNCSTDFADEYFTNGIDGDEITYEAYEDVFIAHDIVYMNSSLNFKESQKVKYNEEDEYAVYYSDSVGSNYVFATLPVENGSTLSQTKSRMTHTAKQAYDNPVLHIQTPGIYSLKGTWNGQILIETDAVVILNGVDVKCTVAPAVLFDFDNELGETDSSKIAKSYKTLGETLLDTLIENETSLVIISDDTENNIEGSNVYRMLKPELKTSSEEQKKRYKIDGAFYSYSSLGIMAGDKGSGILNITSTSFEGLDSEMHMTIDGGEINIEAPDDGINVNEDNISIFTMLDGVLTISSDRGDGIDSNGYVAINGGTLNIYAGTSRVSSVGEAGIDSENTPYVSSKAKYNWYSSGSSQETDTTTPDDDYDYPEYVEIDNSPYDADLISAYITTTRGTTKINIGTGGNNLSFISPDVESYNPRTVSKSGNILRLERKVNTFSGIVTGN